MAAGSFQKINKAALAEVRTHKKVSIITYILLGLGALLYICTGSFSTYTEYNGQFDAVNFEMSPMAMLLFCASVPIGLIAAVLVFRDMNSIQHCDVQHSLPMSSLQRFMSKLLALAYMHIIPSFVFMGSSALIMTLRCMAENAVNTKEIAAGMLCIFAAAMFTDAVSVFTVCCCGALAESIYFSVILVGCLSIIPTMMWSFIWENCGGNVFDYSKILGLWTYSVVYAVENILDESTVSSFTIMTINVLISAAVMLLSYFIYRKRDARSVGTPIYSRLFFEIVMALGVFTVYLAFVLTEINLSYGLIMVIVIYLVINIVISRAKIGVKSFMAWLGKYVLTTAAFLIFVAAAYATDGFSTAKYLPKTDMSGYILDISLEDNGYLENGYRTVDYSSNDDTSDKNMVRSDLTDEQFREINDVYVKYFKKSRGSVAECMSDLFSDSHIYNSNSNNYCMLSIDEPYKAGSYHADHEHSHGWLYNKSFYVKEELGSELEKELDSLGYLDKHITETRYDQNGNACVYVDGELVDNSDY